MKIVSLITARGGSKGIPLKNLVDVNGKPLIYYSINASLQSSVDETWVTTDSKEIADVSKKYEAKVLMRPDQLANDIIMPDDSLIHFLQQSKKLLERKEESGKTSMKKREEGLFGFRYQLSFLP